MRNKLFFNSLDTNNEIKGYQHVRSNSKYQKKLNKNRTRSNHKYYKIRRLNKKYLDMPHYQRRFLKIGSI